MILLEFYFYSSMGVIFLYCLFQCMHNHQLDDYTDYADYTDYEIGIPLCAEDECVICMEPNVDYMLPCTHKYHKVCIHEWYSRSPSCPICRTKLCEE